MIGLKPNSITREQLLVLLKNPPPQGDFEWDGIDEDERPLTREAMRAGIEAARRRTVLPGAMETRITLSMDNDTLAAFRAMGDGWQTRINQALREWLKAHPHSA